MAALALLTAAACSSSSPAFTVTGASVDPSYFCPGGANNASYDLHGTVNVHNGTSKAVTINDITADMTLASVTGDWLEKVGDHFDAGSAKFSPAEVPAGGDAAVKVTITSACTSGKYGTGVSSSGDYRVNLRLATSAGNFTVTASNQHEIIAA